MQHADAYLEVRHSAARGTSRLYTQHWLPDEKPTRAVVVLVHGLGEHSSRYQHVARHCTKRGMAVYALDHYGHGKSDGLPGYVERFSVYLDGVNALLDKVREQHPSLPIFLLGHSMGGLIAATLLQERQQDFRACVLSGPAIRTDEAPPAAVLLLVRILSMLMPTLPLLGLDATAVSRDPKVVKAYVDDPLVHHGKLSARLITEFSAAMDRALAGAAKIELPLLILHGDADRLTSPVGSQQLLDAVSSRDKTLKLYPGLFHEIFNEPEQGAVLADMGAWLEDHLS